MARKKYRFHPACTVFPQLSDDELHDLADDIAVNGLRNPIVLWQGKILDGRNRYLACKIAEVEPRFTEFEGDDPIGWVISQNLQRRHLTASQKAVVALDLLPMLEKEAKQRQRRSNEYRGNGRLAKNYADRNGKGKAAEAAAKIVGASSRYVEMVKSIKVKAPELVKKIRSGELNVSEASRLSELPPDERRKRSYNCTHHFDRLGEPSDIETPPAVCQFLYDIISPKYDVHTILDPCAGNRNLTQPWKRRKVIGFEITKGKDFFKCPDRVDCDLVLCNPPFSGDHGNGRKNLVPLFLQRILEVVPSKTPIVLFTPMTFRLGLSTTAARLLWLRDECPPITSIVSLPRNIFPGVEYHCEIVMFNMRRLLSHYFLPDECLQHRL